MNSHDPKIPNWAQLELEDTWPDALKLNSVTGLWRFFALVLGRRRRKVRLPVGMPGAENLPKYLLQEFHNLPNGNYSRRFSRGYITGFDRSMLGYSRRARVWLASKVAHGNAVLDVGTSGGHTARVVKDAGVPEVWGLDPSPYLLKHAASDHPDIKFLSGIAEDLPFSAERFDGITLCFVLHEIPPVYIKAALASFHRVLKAGGVVAIAEPSEQQLQAFRWVELLRKRGWLKLYFRMLATFVHEPFLKSWHKLDKPSLFGEAGFELVAHELGSPINYFCLRKPR
ncbi:MAG: class I SAM-dependent methyltransferase [Oceanococcus sp.]